MNIEPRGLIDYRPAPGSVGMSKQPVLILQDSLAASFIYDGSHNAAFLAEKERYCEARWFMTAVSAPNLEGLTRGLRPGREVRP